MNISNSFTPANQSTKIDSDLSKENNNSRERRNFEIKRRFRGLQVRRDHLERELQAVKSCLLSLDRQIKNNIAYDQIAVRN